MSTHKRPERVAHLLQQILAELFARGMSDPRIGFVTVTGVKMSPDLREARVYWAVHGEAKDREETARGLEAAKGFLRREVGQKLNLRVTPSLQFTYDEAIDRGERIEKLLRDVHEQDRERVEEKGPTVPGEE